MRKILRFTKLSLIMLMTMSISLSAQTVYNVTDLTTAIANASGGETFVLDATFVPGAMTIPQPSVNITIDASAVVWNAGVIRVNGSGTGFLTFNELKMDGTSISGRLFQNTASAGTLVLEKCEFYNAQGGAVDVSTSGTASTIISYTKIYSNTAHNTAPAVWVGGSADLEIKNSTIENNNATGGGYQCGAVSSNFHTGNLDISNTAFRNNVNKCANSGVIGGGGGAMALHYLKGKVTIDECLFEGNKTNGEGVPVQSTFDGGAIYVFDGRDGATIDIKNTTFDSNIAYDDGGAMMIQGTGNPGLTTTITNCTFYRNKAYGLDGANVSGGAIQFFKNGGSSVMTNTILGCTFIENEGGNSNSTLNQQGGAIALSGAGLFATAAVTYNASLFIGNKVYNSSGQLNTASNYKDISNSTTTQTGTQNVINVDKGATPAYTIEDVLGRNYTFCDNLSAIKVGVNNEIIKTIPLKPQGIADNTYNGTAMLPVTDQRAYKRNKDQGAVDIVWVRFNAGEGKWTGLNDNLIYKGEDYYESVSGEAKMYFKITHSGGQVSDPRGALNPSTAVLSPPADKTFDKWVLDDGTDANVWIPSAVTDTVVVKALYKSTTYKVTYKSGTGSGGPVVIPSVPTGSYTLLNHRDPLLSFAGPSGNYVFSTWIDYAGTDYAEGGVIQISSDTTLIAQWKEITPPVSYLKVTLGNFNFKCYTTDPVAGDYYVKEGECFTFTFNDEECCDPPYTFNPTVLANGDTLVADLQGYYSVCDIRKPVGIQIIPNDPPEVPVGNESLSSDIHVWAGNGLLHLTTEKPTSFTVYMITGQKVKEIRNLSGSATLSLSKGAYLVKASGGMNYKVIVR